MINLDAALHVLMEAEQGRYLTPSLFSFLVAKDLPPGRTPTPPAVEEETGLRMTGRTGLCR